ncbi:terpenoid synthase [Vararia minispora EC-137]|uniref:Terpenoid synthase n=1 Tax=Vararia minispora EC-137 TaxID=1314806 RepID=A0ACB8QFR4_9AGAM|nr:terpenoid synthase [Vararia minispora EC-137]
MTAATSFVLPDLLACSSAFKDASSPHWKRASTESRAWVNSYHVFSDRRAAFFSQGQSELLVSHAYVFAEYDEFRTICDFINLLFVLDEISDYQNAGDARATGEPFLRVLRDPEWSDGSKIALLTQDLFNRFLRSAKPNTRRHFVECCETYIEAVVEEARLREAGEILGLEDFIRLRRENSAVRCCFALIAYGLKIDFPDAIFEDPVAKQAYLAGVDMVCWANDLYSYNMERSSGLAGNNIVTVLMQSHNIDIQAASDYAGEHYKKLMDAFLSHKARLQAAGYCDPNVLRYIEAMQHWMIGNIIWSFETPRYFGALRNQIKETLRVPLKPMEEDMDD